MSYRPNLKANDLMSLEKMKNEANSYRHQSTPVWQVGWANVLFYKGNGGKTTIPKQEIPFH